MVQKNKPPMSIEDMEKEIKGKERGELTYLKGEKKVGNGGPPPNGYEEYREPSGPNWKGRAPTLKSKNPLVLPLVMAIVAILISIFFVFQYAVPKASIVSLAGEIEASRASLDAAVASIPGQVSTAISSEKTRIDTIVNNMSDYARRSELSSFITSSDVSSMINSQVASQISSQVEAMLSSRFASLKSDVDTKFSEYDQKFATWEESFSSASQTIQSSSMEASLSSGGELILTSNKSGWFVCKVTLVFEGNDIPELSVSDSYSGALESFYSELSDSGIIYYPSLYLSGSKWEVTSAVFYTSSFKLEASKEAIFTLKGLRSSSLGILEDYTEAFFEILPSMDYSSSSSSGGI